MKFLFLLLIVFSIFAEAKDLGEGNKALVAGRDTYCFARQ